VVQDDGPVGLDGVQVKFDDERVVSDAGLMLLATLALLTPAIARLPGIAAAGPPAFWGLTDLFVVACFVYDRLTGGRIHSAFKWGGLFVLSMQPVRLIVGGTGPWLALAGWLTR